MVMEKEVNLTLGYFASTAIRDSFMTPSYAYYTSNLLWVIPPGRLNTSLEKLLRPFQFAVWFFFILTLGTSLMFALVIQRYSKNLQDFFFGRANASPCLNIINLTFGGSLYKLPSRNFARILLAFFMIYCFIIQNSYKGGLFQFMQMTLREAEVKSTEEMISKNFNFYMLKSSNAFLTGMPNVLERTIFVTPANYSFLMSKVVSPEFKGALLSSDDHLAYRNIHASPNQFFRHAPETVLTYNIVIYMHKQSCLVGEVNQKIIYLVNSGLVQTWAAQFTDKNFLKHTSTNKAVAINFVQLLGAFQLLSTGLIMGGIIFILEMLIIKFPNRIITKFFF